MNERTGWRQILGDELPFLAAFARFPRLTGASLRAAQRWQWKLYPESESPRPTRSWSSGGTGSFTREIVRRASDAALILAFEINPRFATMLSARFKRVHVIADSAERLPPHLAQMGRESADWIVSGLPWASFGDSAQNRLLQTIVDNLRRGGSFATFADLHASWLPSARRFHQRLRASFATVSITPVVWWNLPPAFVYRCSR